MLPFTGDGRFLGVMSSACAPARSPAGAAANKPDVRDKTNSRERSRIMVTEESGWAASDWANNGARENECENSGWETVAAKHGMSRFKPRSDGSSPGFRRAVPTLAAHELAVRNDWN